MRKALIAVALLALLASFAACARQQPAKTVAVIAVDSDPDTMNTGLSTSWVAGEIGGKIFNGMIWLDNDFKPRPSLAESWDVSPDGLKYVFHLRKNVKWHDGKDLTSADVKFTFEQVLAKHHPRSRTAFQFVDSVTTPDAHTVVVTMKKPYAAFLSLQTACDGPILPRHIYEGMDILKNPANLQPVGSGPFVFKEWVRGDHVTLERNPKYFDKVNLERVIFKIVPQANQRVSALESGDVDYIGYLAFPKSEYARLQDSKTVVAKERAGMPAIGFLFFNTRRAPFDKPAVRHAVAHALDRDKLVQLAFEGLGVPGKGPFGSGYAWTYKAGSEADYDVAFKHDLAKASQLLDQAGLPKGAGGMRVKANLVYQSGQAQFESLVQVIRDQLREVAIDVQLVPLERSAMIDKVYTQYDFDMALQSYLGGADPIIGYHRIYATGAKGVSYVNATGYANPELDALLNNAAATVDLAERERIYFEAQKILVKDLPTLVLFDEVKVDAARVGLEGLWRGIEPREGWEAVSWK